MARDHSRPIKPLEQRMLRARVLRREAVSPRMVRLTIGEGELAAFQPMGFDQWFRFFFPRDGQREFRLPARGDLIGYAQFLATPVAVRPHMRNYSVRAYRADGPSGPEVDIDFVVHAGGVASDWAITAEPGTEVAILDEGIGFAPSADADRVVLVADETGIPAVAGVCASLARDARGIAIIEIAADDERQEFAAPDGVELRWVVRGEERPGAAAFDAVRSLDLDAEGAYAFVVGEASLATGVRRHLVTERGFAKSHVGFCGYWRLPKA